MYRENNRRRAETDEKKNSLVVYTLVYICMYVGGKYETLNDPEQKTHRMNLGEFFRPCTSIKERIYHVRKVYT